MRETPCQKMMRSKAADDRVITTFPKSFTTSLYKEEDFDEKVKNKCATDRNITTGLKISKAIIVGNVSVGKTSIVNRFCHQVFDKDYKATIGVDFEVERFDICHVPFNLQIWDTAGQERFKSIASSYYRGAHIIVVVFDFTDLGSLYSCPKWLEDAIKNNASNPHLFLVGTKKDLIVNSAYKLIEQHAIAIANQMKAEYWAVSAKSNENISRLFSRMAALSFNASVLRECETVLPIQMGNNFVHDSYDDNLTKGSSKCLCVIQ